MLSLIKPIFFLGLIIGALAPMIVLLKLSGVVKRTWLELVPWLAILGGLGWLLAWTAWHMSASV